MNKTVSIFACKTGMGPVVVNWLQWPTETLFQPNQKQLPMNFFDEHNEIDILHLLCHSLLPNYFIIFFKFNYLN